MSNSILQGIGGAEGFKDLEKIARPKESVGAAFTDKLRDAVSAVDSMQKDSEAVQASYAAGAEVDLHDVLIKVEEADLAFKAMMEVRSKLVEAYREVMRMAG